MKTLKLRFLAAEIELHWWFIRRQRRKGNALLKAGIPRSSPKINKLNRRYSSRCAKVINAQKKYEHVLPLTRG
ncbi:MAG: hypothetical protein EOM51_07865 [Clostridia bacterium]|nr:hypothetical protein [Clostridia bacterium]